MYILGKKMKKLLFKNKKNTTLPSNALLGNPDDMLASLNLKYPEYIFQRQNNIFTVELHHSKSRYLSSSADWQYLNESKTAQQAEIGLVQATQILRLITKFVKSILPVMFMENQVPIENFVKQE